MLKSWFFHTRWDDIYFEKLEIDEKICSTLVLHGAGTGDISRTQALREELYARGVPSLAIDFSGHGKSTSQKPLSIRKRIDEAKDVIVWLLDTQEGITLIGFSMSGEVCIRLTEFFNVENLILFAPGIYHRDLIDEPFWEWFTQKIRSHESWRENDIEKILSPYRWNLILLTPEHDTVIPEWVNQIIMQCAPETKKKRIVIEWAPHMVGKWMNEHTYRVPGIVDAIEKYISFSSE